VENRPNAEMDALNLGRLQTYIDMKRIDPTKTITLKELHESGACTKFKNGVKLLSKVRSSLEIKRSFMLKEQ